MEAPFDVLVMDEAQDLFRRTTLDLVNRADTGRPGRRDVGDLRGLYRAGPLRRDL